MAACWTGPDEILTLQYLAAPSSDLLHLGSQTTAVDVIETVRPGHPLMITIFGGLRPDIPRGAAATTPRAAIADLSGGRYVPTNLLASLVADEIPTLVFGQPEVVTQWLNGLPPRPEGSRVVKLPLFMRSRIRGTTTGLRCHELLVVIIGRTYGLQSQVHPPNPCSCHHPWDTLYVGHERTSPCNAFDPANLPSNLPVDLLSSAAAAATLLHLAFASRTRSHSSFSSPSFSSPPQFPNYLTLEEEADGIEVPTIHFVDWFWRTACTMPRGEYDSIFLSSSTYSWAVRVARWLDIKFTLLAYTGPESTQTVARHARSALREAPPARLSHPNALVARNALQEGAPVWTPKCHQ